MTAGRWGQGVHRTEGVYNYNMKSQLEIKRKVNAYILREATEETGLSVLRLGAYLGKDTIEFEFFLDAVGAS